MSAYYISYTGTTVDGLKIARSDAYVQWVGGATRKNIEAFIKQAKDRLINKGMSESVFIHIKCIVKLDDNNID